MFVVVYPDNESFPLSYFVYKVLDGIWEAQT